MPYKRSISSDDTYQLSTMNAIKCKRWGPKFSPDFQSIKLRRVSSEAICYDREHNVKCQGLKPVVKSFEETRKIFRSNGDNYEKVVNRPKSIRYQDSASLFCTKKERMKLKTNLESEELKIRTNIKMGRKTGPDCQDFKAAKMASLSSILEFPKVHAHLQNKSSVGSKFLRSNDSHFKEITLKRPETWRTDDTHIYPGRNCYGRFTRVEGHKVGLWTKKVKSMHHVTEVPLTWVNDAKYITSSLRETNQRNRITNCANIGERTRASNADQYKQQMVTVPLKFMPQKRMATEDLLKETEDMLVNIVGHGGALERPVKRLRSQGFHSELGSCSQILDSEKG